MSSLVSQIASIATRALYLGAAMLLAFLPRLAHACAVCSSGREDENADAFLAMTVFMTLTPLLILGGTIWWFVRRMLEREREVDEERAAAAQRAHADGAPPLPSAS